MLPEDINPIPDQKVIKDGNAGESKAQHAQVYKVSCLLTERVQELFEVLALEQGTLTDNQFSSLKKLIAKHADVFALDNSELGHTELGQHHVDTGESPPIKQPARRIPFVHREKISVMVDEMQKLGVVRPSSSSWASPVVLVPKKDGSYRFCVDCRRLNSLIRKDAHPLPQIDDILDTLDLAAGY